VALADRGAGVGADVVTGLAIEAATDHVEVLVRSNGGDPLALEVEDVGHGHTKRLATLVERALTRANVRASDLEWVAADLGPGSFTGVRVGLATAEALALAAGARVLGASSLAALALAVRARRTLIVPLVPAGRRDLYAGFYRADSRGVIHLLAMPQVGPLDRLLPLVEEAKHAAGVPELRFVGPGAARERAALEAWEAGTTVLEHRHGGLSAIDLANAALAESGPAAGLPTKGDPPRPAYVRSAQAEERVRHAALRDDPVTIRRFTHEDVTAATSIEREIFSDPWPESFFHGELDQSWVYARVAEREGSMVGYLVAWLGDGTGHLGNLAVVSSLRRRGLARRLVEDLLERARALRVQSITLEVRSSNFAAQALYRAHGFRLAGLRRGYYRDTGEDALVMEWRAVAP
jgi:ribosomal-protein-alanine N-acetyltransferase